MSSTPLTTNGATEQSDVATVPMRLEVMRLPVADYDRAKAFYELLGWRLDIEFKPDGVHRALQFTPPGSPTSVQFGEGGETETPLKGAILVVDDVEVARERLIARGVEVGEFWHLDLEKGPQPGLDPQRNTYASRATFKDPEGNSWDLQEITERLPGRV